MQTLAETGTYLRKWQRYLDEQNALQDQTERHIAETQKQLEANRRKLALTEKARELLIAATAATQDQVRDFIEELVSLALQSVFGEEYSFTLEFHERRGQSEMEPVIMWQDERLSPRDEVGGGVVDVASFALRLVLWALSAKRSAPVFLLDEPFKFLSKDRTEAAADMLKGVAELLGIQIIMVSHDEGLVKAADKSWTVRRNSKGIAEVIENT